MKNFFKDNSYTIFKMFVNQLGMMFFGLVLSFATQSNDTLFLVASAFSIVFYLFLLYTMTWEIGYGEKVRIEGKRLRYVPLKGLYMSIVANLPNLILGILTMIGYYGASTFNETLQPASPEWAVNLYGVAKILATFLQAMYSGIVGLLPTQPWIFIVITFPAMITCMIAYIMGVKGHQLFRFLGPDQKRD
ncbi:MAG: hypothetical protein E7618_03820 [Ruminococcaceae bacterium]|nr:hypothetical protein [Oscillospiraceae bacterium]